MESDDLLVSSVHRGPQTRPIGLDIGDGFVRILEARAVSLSEGRILYECLDAARLTWWLEFDTHTETWVLLKHPTLRLVQ